MEHPQAAKGTTSAERKVAYFSSEDLQALMPLAAAIPVMHNAFSLLAQGHATVPKRTQIAAPEHEGVSLFMPARLHPKQGPAALGIKVVSTRPHNAKMGLDSVAGLILVLDDKTGQIAAIMESEYLTAVRTAAGSAIATDQLALPNASSLVVFGAGTQADAHIRAMLLVRPSIRSVVIINRTQSKAEQLAKAFAANSATQHISWSAVEKDSRDEEEAVSRADIIVTATNSSTPLFKGSLLRPGVHLNCIGSYTPAMQEVDCDTVIRAKYIADNTKQVLKEAGDIIIPIQKGLVTPSHVINDLGRVLVDAQKVRTSEDDITLFKSVGNAVQDVAIAKAALDVFASRAAL